MLKLKKLSFSNIGRFIEPQVIDFDNLGNLVQIDAQNNVTGGSSGSGKSTIFNSLDFLLGLSDLSLNILQSRLTKDHLSVEGLFDWDGHKVCIKRAKKLSVTIDGVVTEGSSKLSEEKLDEILGMSRDVFRSLIHKRQGEQGFFLSLKPAEMNSFLVDVLGLSTISSKVNVVEFKAKDLTQAKDKAKSDLQALEAALKATQDATMSIGNEPITDIDEASVQIQKDLVDRFQNEVQNTKNIHKSQKETFDLTKPIITSIAYNRSLASSLELEQKTINNQINLLNNLEKERQNNINKEISALKLDSYTQCSTIKIEADKTVTALKSELNKLKGLQELGKASKEQAIKIAGQVKVLRSGVCHTCAQSWITDSSKLEEERLMRELAKHKSNLEAAAKATVEASTLECTISDILVHSSAQIAIITEQTKLRMDSFAEALNPQIHQDLVGLNQKMVSLSEQRIQEKVKEDEHNKSQNAENQKTLQNWLSDQKVLLNRHNEELSLIQKELEAAHINYEQIKSRLQTWKTLVSDHKRNTEALKARETETISKIGHMTSKVGQIEEGLTIAEEIKRCLKAYLSCSFDDALDSISDSATRILRGVPTMVNATIRLEGTKETAAGAIKDQITACLDNDGEQDIPIKSLSGGERSAVDLAIDLAVGIVIEEKANKGCDIMILDEPFNGFDSVGIENALEMLKTFAMNKRLFLVEHDSIAKEFIQDKITVVRDGETSHIKTA